MKKNIYLHFYERKDFIYIFAFLTQHFSPNPSYFSEVTVTIQSLE